MATIRKHRNKWQVQIRRFGAPHLSKTFHNRKDAEQWARQVEVQADRQDLPKDPKLLDRITLAEIVVKYRDTVTPAKRSSEQERYALNAFLRETLCSHALSTITHDDFARFKDRLLLTHKPSSVTRMLAILHHVFETARKDWQLPIRQNPLLSVKVRDPLYRRERRLSFDELNKIIQASQKTKNGLVLPIILFALETGLRRSEILSATWGHLDLENRVLSVPRAKNGHSRAIPLTYTALNILDSRKKAIQQSNKEVQPKIDGYIFPVTANALRLSWERLRKRAAVTDLHFHDLRHEAISRFFEIGLTVPEVAHISGHRDPRMLFIYSHPQKARILEGE